MESVLQYWKYYNNYDNYLQYTPLISILNAVAKTQTVCLTTRQSCGRVVASPPDCASEVKESRQGGPDELRNRRNGDAAHHAGPFKLRGGGGVSAGSVNP